MWLLKGRADHGAATHEEIEERAYYLWERRGRPIGSPDLDWARAELELREEREPNRPVTRARPGRVRKSRPR